MGSGLSTIRLRFFGAPSAPTQRTYRNDGFSSQNLTVKLIVDARFSAGPTRVSLELRELPTFRRPAAQAVEPRREKRLRNPCGPPFNESFDSGKAAQSGVALRRTI